MSCQVNTSLVGTRWLLGAHFCLGDAATGADTRGYKGRFYAVSGLNGCKEGSEKDLQCDGGCSHGEHGRKILRWLVRVLLEY